MKARIKCLFIFTLLVGIIDMATTQCNPSWYPGGHGLVGPSSSAECVVS